MGETAREREIEVEEEGSGSVPCALWLASRAENRR